MIRKKSAKSILIDLMFVGCFASPVILLFIVNNEYIYVSSSRLILVVGPLSILPAFLSSMLSDSLEIENKVYLISGIVTFCVGLFASMFSLWYALISIHALIFLILQMKPKHKLK